MEWVQFVIFFVGVFGLFIWNRAEGRADMRNVDAKLESQRHLIDEIWRDGRDFKEQMLKETYEFHHRLLEIERGRK